MKKLILLVLLISTVSAYDLGGSINNKGLGLYVRENLSDKLFYTVVLSQEYDKHFTKIVPSRVTRCGCPVTKPNKQAVHKKALPSLVTKYYSRDVARLKITLGHTIYDALSAYVGTGYSFTQNVYKDDVFMPVGLRYTLLAAESIIIDTTVESYVSQGLQHEELVSVMVGYTF